MFKHINFGEGHKLKLVIVLDVLIAFYIINDDWNFFSTIVLKINEVCDKRNGVVWHKTISDVDLFNGLFHEVSFLATGLI